MKEAQHTAARDRMARSRYAELKQMLDGRRRELQAEVQGKMRVVREEGTWGGKQNDVFDAVEIPQRRHQRLLSATSRHR